ncbi:hypothetical protein HR060_11505 [Catenovulum sp. SM1970]|uniref:hypothetical protein n=1 Tax=Marinifaba aquimaris TaxID=2741323 RepID=UPI0015717414|nr:hypothetical protein [Marinifaba aquimaris]NTS77488.1 hypothetical protein [Marinifaba aquimaris]
MKFTLKIFTAWLPFIGILFLVGCSSTPYQQDWNNINWQSGYKEVRKEEKLKINYMSRLVLEHEARVELRQQLDQAGYKATKGQIGVDLQNPYLKFFMQAKGINASTNNEFAVQASKNGYFEDGSLSYTTQIWLPQYFEGHNLDNVEIATKVAREYVQKKIENLATEANFEYSCLKNCNGKHQVHLLKNKASNSLPYVFVPKDIVFSIRVAELEPVVDDPYIENILGFKPRWKSPDGFNFFIEAYYDAQEDSTGNKILDVSPSGIIVATSEYKRDSFEVSVGLDLYNQIFDNPYMFFGHHHIKGFAFYNKKIYFGSNNDDAFCFDKHVYPPQSFVKNKLK